VLALSVGCARTAPLHADTAWVPEIFSTGCGMTFGADFVAAVPVVDGDVGVGKGVLAVEDVVDGLAGAVAGSVAVDGRIVLRVGAAAVRVLEGRVDGVVDSLVLPQPLMSAPPASAAITHVDSLGDMLLSLIENAARVPAQNVRCERCPANATDAGRNRAHVGRPAPRSSDPRRVVRRDRRVRDY
jgi:hypothetical protein